MALTEQQRKGFREAAEARLAEQEKEKRAELHRQRLQQQLRHESTAAAKEQKTKDEARRIYLAEGGSLTTFEKNWAEMYEQLVTARTIEAMKAPYAERRRAVGHKPLGLG